MGSSWAEAWGLFFYCEGGTRRDGRAGERLGRGGGGGPGRGGERGGTGGEGRAEGGYAPERGANG